MKNILIVEDGKEIRELLLVVFKLSGFKNISFAETGDDGVKEAKKMKPDLVIMDMKMPGNIDGLEATRIIKNEPGLKKSKIVMLSANCQRTDVEAGFNAGADAYFFKPFSPVEFMNNIMNLLKESKLRKKGNNDLSNNNLNGCRRAIRQKKAGSVLVHA